MSSKTAIAWTDRTWNPVTGCDRISSGCDSCYALTLAATLKADGAKRYQNDGDPATSGPGFGVTLHPDLVRQPLAWKSPSVPASPMSTSRSLRSRSCGFALASFTRQRLPFRSTMVNCVRLALTLGS